jgi:HEAT repeats
MTDYDLILAGEPVAATAAAKRLIAAAAVDAPKLRDIACDKTSPAVARIVAIYVLAFTDDGSLAAATLRGIAADRDDAAECRRHAATALARLHAPGVVTMIEDVLSRDEAATVQRWCVNTLGDIDGTMARNALLNFASTDPAGEVAGALRIALARQWFRTRELGATLRDILRQGQRG